MVKTMEMTLEEQQSKLETVDAKANFGTRGWILIIIGWMCFYMSASAVNDSLNVTIPLFKSLYGWSDGSISRIATYSGWVGALLTLPAAMVMRKKGTRFVLLCSEAIMCFCVLMLGFITDVFVYALNFVMITFAGNCIGQLAFGALASHWFPRKKGAVMGWATVGCNLGSCTVVWLLAASFTLPSVHLYFVPYCLIPAAAFILTLLFIRDFPEEAGCYPDNDKHMTPEMARKIYEEGQAYVKTSPWTARKILALRQSWCIIFGLGIFQLCTMGIVSHIVPILSSRGFTDEQALIGMTAAGIFAIPCSIALGAIDSRFGTRKAAMLLGAVSLVMFSVTAVPTQETAVVGALAGGLMMGCSNNLLVSMVTSIFGRFDFDKAIGVILPIYMVVGCSGVGLVGTVSDLYGVTGTMILLAILCVISLFLLRLIPDVCIGRSEFTQED